MFRFTIRDVLWLTVVVAMGLAWWNDRRQAEREKQAVFQERDAAVANEHRLAELRAREMAGALRSPRPGERPHATQTPISD